MTATITENHTPRTDTGLLTAQNETAVTAYRTLILEQLERIAQLEAQLEDATSIATRYAKAIIENHDQIERYRRALLSVIGTDNYEDAVQAAQEALAE